jgi:biofilm PGA synthesis protein PgaA
MTDRATADPPEGPVERTRLGAGLDYRTHTLRAAAMATQSFGTLAEPGAALELDWIAADTWRLAFSAERFAAATPLRALRERITADEIAARITWRQHESRSLSLRLAWLPFSDGNRRSIAGLEARERILDLPHLDITARGDLYFSANSRSDGPYFSPSRDLSATTGVLVEYVTWRRYENSFVQSFSLDAGTYSQEGYATGWIGTAAYEHRWRFDPLTELRYGVQLTRRLYDGEAERGISFIVALTQRL